MSVVGGASGQAHQAELSPPATVAELNLVATALQAESIGPFFPSGRLIEAVSLLRRIHLEYPSTRIIAAVPSTESDNLGYPSLQFDVPDSLCNGHEKHSSENPRDVDVWLNPWKSGLRDFDSVTAKLGGARIVHLECMRPYLSELTVYYRRPVNIPGVARSYADVHGVTVSPLQDVVGGGNAFHIEVGDVDWSIEMLAGWGDCPAGCINNHTWTFKYHLPTGRLELVSETGPPLPEK